MSVGDRSFEITLPADPDAFLEDAATLEEHARRDHMPYWPYLWPAAETMAGLVFRAEWPGRPRVLEIGCGIGFVGLAALARGDAVTFSDYRAEAVQLAVENARRNGFPDATGVVLDYRQPASNRFPVILGCDVIYESPLHAPVLGLIEAMLSPDGVCWLGDAGRHTAAEFAKDAAARGFEVRLFDAAGEPAHAMSPGEFRLIELRNERAI